MMPTSSRLSTFAVATFSLTAFLALGCSGGAHGAGFESASNAAPDAGNDNAPIGDGGSSGALTSGNDDASTATAGPTIFYVHTNTTLYTVDPANVSAPPVEVGDFDCIGGTGNPSAMTDVGVAKDGSLYGVSQKAAYPLTIAGGVVHCAATWPLPGKNDNFYGLTVAPENTVATNETLIAADDSGALWQIDATTGATVQVGTLGIDPITSKPWRLSGDIAFLANHGSPLGFATVRVRSTDGDTLIQIDVARVQPGTASAVKSVIGPVVQGASCAAPTSGSAPDVGTGFQSMYGISAFEDKVYGFSHKGDIVEIDNSTGTACLLGAMGTSMAFAGAGVTTSAAVVAPTPR